MPEILPQDLLVLFLAALGAVSPLLLFTSLRRNLHRAETNLAADKRQPAPAQKDLGHVLQTYLEQEMLEISETQMKRGRRLVPFQVSRIALDRARDRLATDYQLEPREFERIVSELDRR